MLPGISGAGSRLRQASTTGSARVASSTAAPSAFAPKEITSGSSFKNPDTVL
jgi:hypothetical protein